MSSTEVTYHVDSILVKWVALDVLWVVGKHFGFEGPFEGALIKVFPCREKINKY